jgi:DNA-binding transcriptional ArsR family regulator
MLPRHRLAEIASVLGDPGRAAMVTSLWDGRLRPASELAKLAGVSAPTASSHLARLVATGLLAVEPRGRHRYYRLAGPRVAQLLEAFADLMPPRAATVAAGGAAEPLRAARLCYDHLAGSLGVSIADALLDRRLIEFTNGAFVLAARGRSWFERFGVDVASLAARRRPMLRACLDWTERREHLGGALGAALAAELLERDWVRRELRSRALHVTTDGRRGFHRSLGIRLP